MTIFVPTNFIGRMAKRKTLHIPWGLIALLSFVVMMVSFAIPYPPLVIALIPVFLVSCAVSFSHWISFLKNASANPFDDYGYC